MPAVDLARVRADTPGTANVIHLNNAGAALMPAPVVRATVDYLEREAAIGGYEAHAEADAAIEATYGKAAKLIGAAPDEIAFIENATRAWDMAFYGLGASFAPGDRILTGAHEYVSNYQAYLQVAKRTGAVIEVIPNDNSGQVSAQALESMIDRKVKLIGLTHVPTNGGVVNPAAAIGKVARAAGVPFLLDACQSVGQMPIDVSAIGCDMLSTTGRKYLRGPRGTGFLFVRRDFLERIEPPMVDTHAATWPARSTFAWRPDTRRFENWETNFSTRLGLAAAIDYAMGIGLEAIYARVQALASDFRARLDAIGGVKTRDLGTERCGIVTFTVAGKTADEVKAALAAKRINVSTTTVNGTRVDMEQRGLDSMTRASVHYYNSEDEVAVAVEAVAALRR
ncbi:MAG: aminotransferase class V-fold PLP-dependent enzyme [Rhodospirillaceae bacterium]|nr:aminotransferase class V-fold PLP-dependent enzyme [Rhodospirillaceae bacterium]